MKRISLISNTSIQYYRFESEINLDFGKSNKIYFQENLDTKLLKFTFQSLFKFSKDGNECFYKKTELLSNDFLVNDKIKEGVDLSGCTEIFDAFEISNVKSVLKKFKRKWIPLPFFKSNEINKNIYAPVDWVRCFFDCDNDYTKIKIVLAIDTILTTDGNDLTSPILSLNPDENLFKLNCNEEMINNFLFNPHHQIEWIGDYIADLFYDKNDSQRYEKPITSYISNYLMFVKFLNNLKETPEIQLFTDDARKIPVDLVVDLGNSATCALLFENQSESKFSFDKVKKLIINDFSNPILSHNEPFPMNLVFCESNFGNINSEKYHKPKFITPSFVRIGEEAKNLIDNSTIEISLGRELHTFNSSPKRYLWDTKTALNEWDFYPKDLKKIKKVYLNGLSEQLKVDGSLANGQLFGSKSLYSRNSLMKFVFLEILNHAFVQMNSFEFRSEHGNLTMPRVLKRITISCPTAMIQYEQIALREAAEDACKLLNEYIKISSGSNVDKNWFEIPEIIPSIKDLKRDQTELDEKKDWNYDEATSCQLVFAYSLLSKKLLSNQFVLKNTLLKKQNKLTIGSIDIGAGTTDLMICEHDINLVNGLTIKPKPLFWESFKIAGDDLMKELIQQIVIEGVVKNDSDDSCTGVIENYAKSIGIENISEKLNGFFGQDSNNIGYIAKMMRKAFINQVALPICKFYLDKANVKCDEYYSFEGIIGRDFKNQELIKYFNNHFGFNFLEIKWRISSIKVNDIVEAVFRNVITQLSLIISQCNCDYLVLSGKTASLKLIEDLFLKSMSVNADNLINLNNYWIGKWFPFSDNKGNVKDPKTVVSVGAILALMSGKLNKIADFKIDTEHLKNIANSTADNILINQFNSVDTVFTPKKNESELKIYKIPSKLIYSKIIDKNYPISQIYSIDFNDLEILKNIKRRKPNLNDLEYLEQVNKFKADTSQKMPLKLCLSRDNDASKENILIDSIEDSDGDELPVKSLVMNYQTLDNENGYWLDTCEFILNARS